MVTMRRVISSRDKGFWLSSFCVSKPALGGVLMVWYIDGFGVEAGGLGRARKGYQYCFISVTCSMKNIIHCTLLTDCWSSETESVVPFPRVLS